MNTNIASDTKHKPSGFLVYLRNFYFNFFGIIGLFGVNTLSAAAKIWCSFYRRFLKKYVNALDRLWLNILKGFSKFGRAIKFKAYAFIEFFIDAKDVIVGGYRLKPNASAPKKLFNSFKAFFRGVRNNVGIFVSMLNYALPVVAIFAFVNLIGYVSHLNFAVAVEYNGEHLGYIENEKVFESAGEKLQSRMIYLDDDETIDTIPKFTVAVINDESLKSDAEITDAIIMSSAGEIVKATGLTIDGEFYGAVKNGATLTSALSDMLNQYKSDDANETVAFARDVKTETGIFKASNIVPETALISQITELQEKEVYYDVVSGDTPIMIAAKNDMDLDTLTALNPDILTDCKIGKQVLVNKAMSFLPVKVIRQESYDVSIDYETTYTETGALYKGQSRTSKAGVEGTALVTASVEYMDGVEVARTELSKIVTAEPIAAVVQRGTKEMPAATWVNESSRSDYGLIWPVSGGYISQYYGNYGHNGIDYAYRGNGYGQPIVAALPGTITFAGYNGSYGNLVIVTSAGGIQTWYAHCSSILVAYGQTVAQGDTIARVGSTGNSTGNHLHFRVLINGTQRNPLNYLP